MDAARRDWVEHVLVAAQSAADSVRTAGDPYSRRLLDDLEQLCERLRAELNGRPVE